MLMKAWFISFTVKKAYLNHVQQNSLSEKKSSYLQFISSIAFDTNSSSFHNYLHMLEEIPLKSFETPQKRIRFVLPITWFIWCWKGSNPGAAAFHAFSPIYFPFLHRHMLHRVRGDLLKLESDKWFRCGNVALSSLHISTYPFSSNPTKSPVPTDVGLLGKVEGGEMIDIGNDPPPNHFLVTEAVFSRGVLQMFKIFVLQEEKSIRCTCRAAWFAPQCVRYCSFMHEIFPRKSRRGWRPYVKGGEWDYDATFIGKITLLWLPTHPTNTPRPVATLAAVHVTNAVIMVAFRAWKYQYCGLDRRGGEFSCNHHFAYVMVAVLLNYFREMGMCLILLL